MAESLLENVVWDVKTWLEKLCTSVFFFFFSILLCVVALKALLVLLLVGKPKAHIWSGWGSSESFKAALCSNNVVCVADLNMVRVSGWSKTRSTKVHVHFLFHQKECAVSIALVRCPSTMYLLTVLKRLFWPVALNAFCWVLATFCNVNYSVNINIGASVKCCFYTMTISRWTCIKLFLYFGCIPWTGQQ